MRWPFGVGYVLFGVMGITGGCAAVPPCPLPEAAQTVSSQMPQTTPEPVLIPVIAPPGPSINPTLERKVKAQEKRIAELSAQLRILKRIDLERTKQ